MPHIVKSEQEIAKISQLLEKFRINGYKNNILEEILNEITPQNPNLPIKIILSSSEKPAYFHEKEQKIEISSEALKSYIIKLTSSLVKKHPNIEKEIFYNFVLLVLAHEVEHYYQSLIKNKYIDFPYNIVIDGYKNLSTIKLSKDINPNLAIIKIKRFINCYNGPYSLIERNANVEASDILIKIATYESNKEMLKILNDFFYFQLTIGYEGLSNGAMEKTYKRKGIISVFNSFNHNEIIPIEDKIRYGLPIDDETRKKVLKKQFHI